jgi:hypothetical protein
MSGSIVLSVMALLALIELYISIANPWKLMDKFYNFGCKYYRIGQMRQGIWGMAKTPVQFRIFTGIATALLATLCIYFSILLY